VHAIVYRLIQRPSLRQCSQPRRACDARSCWLGDWPGHLSHTTPSLCLSLRGRVFCVQMVREDPGTARLTTAVASPCCHSERPSSARWLPCMPDLTSAAGFIQKPRGTAVLDMWLEDDLGYKWLVLISCGSWRVCPTEMLSITMSNNTI